MVRTFEHIIKTYQEKTGYKLLCYNPSRYRHAIFDTGKGNLVIYFPGQKNPKLRESSIPKERALELGKIQFLIKNGIDYDISRELREHEFIIFPFAMESLSCLAAKEAVQRKKYQSPEYARRAEVDEMLSQMTSTTSHPEIVCKPPEEFCLVSVELILEAFGVEKQADTERVLEKALSALRQMEQNSN